MTKKSEVDYENVDSLVAMGYPVEFWIGVVVGYERALQAVTPPQEPDPDEPEAVTSFLGGG